MRRELIAFAALLAAGPALGSPGAAPWDHDGGRRRADCSQCHFDGEVHRQSGALKLDGLPKIVEAGAAYELTLALDHADLLTAGFLITSDIDGEAAGAFEAIDDRTLANGAALRSTNEGARQKSAGSARWNFRWTTPAHLGGAVTFFVAANAANDDASALGDQIFVSTFKVAARD